MQRYVEQLLEDIKEATNNPSSPSFIDPYLFPDVDRAIVELAKTPFYTIEELTGISQSAFPEVYLLDGNQIKMLNTAIIKLLNSLNIDLIDKPKHLPKELLYDVFVVYWDDYVQHLPSSGFEWDLCTGDQNTCPFGIYCDCNKTFDFADMNLIPEAK